MKSVLETKTDIPVVPDVDQKCYRCNQPIKRDGHYKFGCIIVEEEDKEDYDYVVLSWQWFCVDCGKVLKEFVHSRDDVGTEKKG